MGTDRGSAPDEGGDAACWAHLVCPECGAVEIEGHRPGCPAGDAEAGADPPVGSVRVVRVYEDPGRSAREHRVLVDRLWPRGVRREAVDHDSWERDVAPSTQLRRWYGHEPSRFAEFADRYRSELGDEPGASALARLRDARRSHALVLLTATRDVEHSAAAVLAAVLDEGPAAGGPAP